VQLRPIDREHRNAGQPGLRAQPQHFAEDACQGRLMALPKARDRAVIGLTVRRNHPKRDVLDTSALDNPRGALPARVRVDQQRDHHRRIVRRTTVPVGSVIGVKRSQVDLLDDRDHEPREVIRRQPIVHARRQQEHLIAIAP
jgi:hypothetical protein